MGFSNMPLSSPKHGQTMKLVSSKNLDHRTYRASGLYLWIRSPFVPSPLILVPKIVRSMISSRLRDAALVCACKQMALKAFPFQRHVQLELIGVQCTVLKYVRANHLFHPRHKSAQHSTSCAYLLLLFDLSTNIPVWLPGTPV